MGTWTRTTTCAEQLQALSRPGLRKYALEMVAGNRFIPGVRSPDQLKDPAQPCRGAVPRKHSHFFTKDGRFGSLDWNGQDVDDGTYTLSTNRVSIAKEFPRVTFLTPCRQQADRLCRRSRRVARRFAVPGRSRWRSPARPGRAASPRTLDPPAGGGARLDSAARDLLPGAAPRRGARLPLRHPHQRRRRQRRHLPQAARAPAGGGPGVRAAVGGQPGHDAGGARPHRRDLARRATTRAWRR